MTNVERFHAVMNFEKPDRLPMVEWAGWWGATLDRWYGEGLSREIPWDRIQTHLGLDLFVASGCLLKRRIVQNLLFMADRSSNLQRNTMPSSDIFIPMKLLKIIGIS